MTIDSAVALQAGERPLVSVVVPVFNAEKYIRCTLDSILAQDYRPLEIVVVDDGSGDATLSILETYGDRVRVFRQPNRGSAAARNFGIREAKGEWVAFLDADDYWFPGKLSTQMGALAETGCRMAYSRFAFWHPDAQGLWPVPASQLAGNETDAGPVRRWVYADLLLDCLVWTSTVVAERALLVEAGGFDEDLRKGQDYDFWLRLSRLVEMAEVQRITALYRIHGESITHKPNPRCFEYEIVSRAVERWGVSGPDGRSPGRAVVVARIRRAACNFAAAHWRFGDLAIGLDYLSRLRREYGLGTEGVILYLRMRATAMMRRLSGQGAAAR